MLLIKGGKVLFSEAWSKIADILVKDGKIVEIAENIGKNNRTVPLCSTIDATGLVVAPGLVDMHVHFREPGFEYKEDIQTGAASAAAGGVTTCCCMPNTSPVADNAKIIEYIKSKAEKTQVKVLPIGTVTIGQKGKVLTDFAALKRAGAIALSDDGVPITDDEIMKQALISASMENMLLISHCEEEEQMVLRDTRLAAGTGTRVHIAHVSTAQAVDTIRNAKAKGVNVTAEACPHHFALTEAAIAEKGTLARMSPPLRTQMDVDAIIEGLCDGTIDAIATDHAPHSQEEKALPFDKAPNGIIGLETLLASALTSLYHTGKLSMEKVIKLMTSNPARLLGLEPDMAGILDVGGNADIVIFDCNEKWTVNPEQFKSKARNTPYGGVELYGKVKYTISAGETVYSG